MSESETLCKDIHVSNKDGLSAVLQLIFVSEITSIFYNLFTLSGAI